MPWPTGTSSLRATISALEPCAPPTALVWPRARSQPSRRSEPLPTDVLPPFHRSPTGCDRLQEHTQLPLATGVIRIPTAAMEVPKRARPCCRAPLDARAHCGEAVCGRCTA